MYRIAADFVPAARAEERLISPGRLGGRRPKAGLSSFGRRLNREREARILVSYAKNCCDS
jgi:hypothetical protein